jgi:hypothetical protein
MAATLFTAVPSAGEILPGEAAELAITFCSTAAVDLADCKDLRMTVTEPHTGESVATFPLPIACAAVWPQVKLTPPRGISFGAAFHASESRT